MSVPHDPDIVKVSGGDGESPEVFTLLCGIENLDLNQEVNTSQVPRRDCAKPGLPAVIKNKVQSFQWSASGTGVWNTAQTAAVNALLGISQNYKFEFGVRDGSDGGQIIGIYTGNAMLTSNNVSVGDEGTASLNILGNDRLVWDDTP